MAYNPIKRLRSWFFATNIPTEPRTYIDGNGNAVVKQVKTRLGKGQFPKEETFQDLIATTFLKSSGDDLQDVSSTAEIYGQADVEKVVKPNQLPTLREIGGNTLDDFPTDVYEVGHINETGRKNYYWRFKHSFIAWLLGRLPPTGGLMNQVLKKTSNANYNYSWQAETSASSLPPLSGANLYLQTNANNTGAAWVSPPFASMATVVSEIEIRTDADTSINDRLGGGVGAYVPNVSSSYITSATSFNNADVLLATALSQRGLQQATDVNSETTNPVIVKSGATIRTEVSPTAVTVLNPLGQTRVTPLGITINKNSFDTVVTSAVLTADRAVTLPDKSGTVAMTSDIAAITVESVGSFPILSADVNATMYYQRAGNILRWEISGTFLTSSLSYIVLNVIPIVLCPAGSLLPFSPENIYVGINNNMATAVRFGITTNGTFIIVGSATASQSFVVSGTYFVL